MIKYVQFEDVSMLGGPCLGGPWATNNIQKRFTRFVNNIACKTFFSQTQEHKHLASNIINIFSFQYTKTFSWLAMCGSITILCVWMASTTQGIHIRKGLAPCWMHKTRLNVHVLLEDTVQRTLTWLSHGGPRSMEIQLC